MRKTRPATKSTQHKKLTAGIYKNVSATATDNNNNNRIGSPDSKENNIVWERRHTPSWYQ